MADFGGPGDIVHPDVGYKIPLTNENDFVAQMENILTELAQNRDQLNRLRRQGMAYAKERLTWEAKAQDTTRSPAVGLRRGPNQIFCRRKPLVKNTIRISQEPAPCAGVPAFEPSR